MSNYPMTTLFVDREGLDEITSHACVLDDGHLVGSIRLAPYFGIQTEEDVTVIEFAKKLHEIATTLEQKAIRSLSEAFRVSHPEEPTPIGRGGRCLGCGRIVAMLFSARVSLGGAEWDCVEACATCSHVRDDLADVFDAATIKINPEGDDPRAIREEQHDLGMDVPA